MNTNGIWSAGWLSVVCVPLFVILFEAEPVLGQTLDPNPPAPWIKFVTGDLACAMLIVVYVASIVALSTGRLGRETVLRILVGAVLVGVGAVCGTYFLANQVAWWTLFFTFIGAGLIVMLFDPVARIRRWEQRRLWGV